jgi:hypothetical protein
VGLPVVLLFNTSVNAIQDYYGSIFVSIRTHFTHRPQLSSYNNKSYNKLIRFSYTASSSTTNHCDLNSFGKNTFLCIFFFICFNNEFETITRFLFYLEKAGGGLST